MQRSSFSALFYLRPFASQRERLIPANRFFRGWISDEKCARGRAEGSDGVYTGTNPECAKECVAKGKKIVFIDPDKKKIFVITNQEAAKANVGDYVEVKGALDAQLTKLQIDSIKMLEKGSAMCAAKPKKKT